MNVYIVDIYVYIDIFYLTCFLLLYYYVYMHHTVFIDTEWIRYGLCLPYDVNGACLHVLCRYQLGSRACKLLSKRKV